MKSLPSAQARIYEAAVRLFADSVAASMVSSVPGRSRRAGSWSQRRQMRPAILSGQTQPGQMPERGDTPRHQKDDKASS